MKTAWVEVGKRLERQGFYTESIIRGAIADRSQRSVNKLLWFEIAGVIILAGVLPFIIWVYTSPRFANVALAREFMFTLMIFVPLALVWTLVKISVLFPVDMTGSIVSNLRCIRRYELYVGYERKSMYFAVPFLLLFCGVLFILQGAPFVVWVSLVVMYIVVILFTVYNYKRLYPRNISRIKESLNELRDLKSEE